VLWAYPGLPAEDMEKRVIFLSERAFSTTVNGISNIESSAIPGVGTLRVYFEDGTDIGAAIAQISAVCGTAIRSMPPGITPPLILQYNASNVPVAQLTLFSDTLPETTLFDYGLNFIRLQLFTIPGLATPAPYGGKQRQINIDVNPELLQAKGLSPQSVVDALTASNIILPAGTARIGSYEYNILLNSSPDTVPDFNKIPIKVVNGAALTIGDVATASDGFADQTNIVRVNGKRAAYLNILKKSGSSTLAVIAALKKKVPEILALAPKGFNVRVDFDQSVFVQAAINGVLREALVSGILVSLMILLFLGSWRSVIIVCTSIPAAICAAIIGLKFTGNSINIMTLGGLSLAIGMLVDDATVEVENIHRNRGLGKPLTVAILDGASQIALPAIMATLAICIVFFPVVLLTGPSRFLFVPMALSVVFSMMASYLLSRTLVPLLSRMLLVNEPHEEAPKDGHAAHAGMFPKFNAAFDKLTDWYLGILDLLLKYRGFTLWTALALLTPGS
jgi:multidrug efflux pump subunit AcrB